MFKLKTGVKIFILLAIVQMLCACATVDFNFPKPDTRLFRSTKDTYIGQRITPLVTRNPGTSGFFLLADGIDALGARLLMAERAERSIDVQYYLITRDVIGYVFMGALLKAADRGVRVRLLLDDFQAQGYDADMASLNSHPNFEVRMFNPFAGRSWRMGDAIRDFGRINRRMHNKSFTVDNQMTIIGGRNIAAEYFGARKDANFGDVDVLGVGPVVEDVSQMFDTYWNSRMALPVPAFAVMPDDTKESLQQLRDRIEENNRYIRKTKYADAVRSDIEAYINTDSIPFHWAPFVLAYDSPEKADKDRAPKAQSILTTLWACIQGARNEVVIVSPYFVPQENDFELFRNLRNRDVEVTVITNSLAATNHSVVHSGYAPARKPLLKMGLKLYEFKNNLYVNGIKRGGAGASLATLHTKAFIVDRRELFIGSFNWDPRSANINTELGVIIRSSELASTVADSIDMILDTKTYEVILNKEGYVRWIDRSGNRAVVLDKEPDTGFWRRFGATVMQLLPIKGQL